MVGNLLPCGMIAGFMAPGNLKHPTRGQGVKAQAGIAS